MKKDSLPTPTIKRRDKTQAISKEPIILEVPEGFLKELPGNVRADLFSMREGMVTFIIQTMGNVEKYINTGKNPNSISQDCKTIKRIFESLGGK